MISVLYSVTSTVVFLKDVAVNIQHSAVIRSGEDQAKFKFIIAKSSQPNRFEERKGTFSPNTQYGTIMLNKLDTVIGQTAPSTTALYCTSFVFYKPTSMTNDVKFHFVVIRKLNALDKVQCSGKCLHISSRNEILYLKYIHVQCWNADIYIV